ncbi:hypothetical protein ACWEJP_09495 [Streptomyces sp. NPDC004749]
MRKARGEVIRKIVADSDFDPVLLGVDAARYPCLGGIDSYGDTIFNGLQVQRLLEELDSYKAICSASVEFMEDLDELCRMVKSGTHRFIWFIGD